LPRPKITMVGGGSVNWSPGLIRDFLAHEEFESADFRLLDIDLDAAKCIAAVGGRCVDDWGLGATFLPTKSPARALDGADVVVITISTGGLDAMKHDLAIPQRYGIFQTVGDTVGPGGWARGLRNIPVFMKFARQFGRYCPDAAVLNYTNPMSVLTKTLAHETDQPVVGLCHGLFECYAYLMQIFGLKREEDIRARYCGINHFFWILDFSIKGKPGYPMLRRKMRGGKTLDDLIRTTCADEAGYASPRRLVASELFETYGYLPYFGDRHICEFLPRYVAATRDRLAAYRLVRTSIPERRAMRRAAKATAERIAAGKKRMDRAPSRETAADIARAILAGRELVDVMNLPNVGQVSNLPAGAVVETPGIVGGGKFRPVDCGEMPAALANLLMPHITNQELIVEAGIEGDRQKAYQALIGDPLCSHLPIPKIKQMGAKLLEANGQYLPQFFGRQKKT